MASGPQNIAFFNRPRQCANCHKYNHSTTSCHDPKICISSAGDHRGECTSPETKCANCKGGHNANDKSCPAYKHEINLQKFREECHLALRYARRLFQCTSTSSAQSYPQVASSFSSYVDVQNTVRFSPTNHCLSIYLGITDFYC